jgi:hypothetical protein
MHGNQKLENAKPKTQNSKRGGPFMKSTFQFCALSFELCALSFRFAVAAKTCSPEAEWKVAKAADCLDRRDSGCAKIRLDSVLEREPNCAEALFVKAWVLEYYDQKGDAAQAMRERALKLNPELSEFWERRGRYIESQLSSQEFSHFDLQFYGAEDREKAWRAVKYLNEMYNELGSVFGVFPTKRIPVIIFTTMAYIDAWRMPFTGGFFDKRDSKVRIRFDEMPGGEAEFRRRARHELSHAYIYHIYPQDLPPWAAEGIAEFYSRRNPAGGYWKEERLEEIRKILKGYEWLTLEDVGEALGKKQVSVMTVQRAYLESEALALYVAKDRGESWIPNVIHRLRQQGGTFDAAFEAVLSTTPSAMMERLHHSWD